MTPQERQLLTDLFDRLAELETAPRDPEAKRAIEEGLQRAPNAIYPLVQTVLVQDEALKRANAHIQELEAQLGEPEPPPSSGGFLDNMREKLLGRQESPRGSVPSVRPSESLTGAADARWGQAQPDPRWNNPDSRWNQTQQYQQPYAPPPASGGGSFLGTAASAAAGMVGGALLLDGIRSMFGHSASAHASAFDPGLSGTNQASPWGSGESGDLARQAGLDDIGQSTGGHSDNQAAGLFDAGGTDDNDDNVGDYSDYSDYDDSDADFSDDGTTEV